MLLASPHQSLITRAKFKPSVVKLALLLLSTVFSVGHSMAATINAQSCNRCSADQAAQRALSLPGTGVRYVVDQHFGAIWKFSVYRDSSCRPIPGGKGVTQHSASDNLELDAPMLDQSSYGTSAGGCNGERLADELPVEAIWRRKGEVMGTIYGYFGTTIAKVEIDVRTLDIPSTSQDADAFDYLNRSYLRNEIYDAQQSGLRRQVGHAVTDALLEMTDTADRILTDGAAGTYYMLLRFRDGSLIRLKVTDSTTSVIVEARDANGNAVPRSSTEIAMGAEFRFDQVPSDQVDYIRYLISIGVNVIEGSAASSLPVLSCRRVNDGVACRRQR
jgi:hypothetical protein